MRALTVAKALVNMFSLLRVPEQILSDMGTQFVLEFKREVSRLPRIRHLITTPYHPMCNGVMETFNWTLKTMLRTLCSEQQQ